MKLKRPTRWPCSADSRRNAGPAPRSLRKAETGVSVSSTKVWRIGTRLWAAARARAVSSDGVASATPSSAATALIEHALRVGEGEAAGPQQDGEVVEDV